MTANASEFRRRAANPEYRPQRPRDCGLDPKIHRRVEFQVCNRVGERACVSSH